MAAVGLALVLDLLSGADLSLPGVLWALAAMVGAASYFVISADESNGLPPLALAAGGLVTGTAVLGLLARRRAAADAGDDRTPSSTPARRSRGGCRWSLLGIVTAAISYTTGIAAGRRLGSRLASFVALTEVVAGVLWAWLLLVRAARPGRSCSAAC